MLAQFMSIRRDNMYKEQVYDATTGEITWRDYTPEEIALVEQTKAIAEAKAKELINKEVTRQAALNKLIDLGLTEEEVKAFLG